MAKANERTLFGDPDEPSKPPASSIPFDAALMALGTVRGLGHKGLQVLVRHFGENLGAIFALNDDDIKGLLADHKLSNCTKIALTIAHSSDDLLAEGGEQLRQLAARRVKILSPSQLPERLSRLGTESPKWLFVEGDETLLAAHPTVAVVGTRKPTDLAYRATNAVCHVLSSYPLVVVSGLADGIDGEAHSSSMNRGMKNVAFLGHGINITFPEQTSGIRADIIKQGGAVVSEYMPDQSYQKHQFVERNRLQAALADLVIPVEAAAASGTAHTARFARKYGRRIVGVRWNGAIGIVEDLAKAGDEVVDVLTASGQKQLDAIVQSVLEAFGRSMYPFQALERQIAREMNGRTFRPEDVTTLAEAIHRLGKGASGNG